MTEIQDTRVLGFLALILGNVTDGWISGVWLVCGVVLLTTAVVWQVADWRLQRERERLRAHHERVRSRALSN